MMPSSVAPGLVNAAALESADRNSVACPPARRADSRTSSSDASVRSQRSAPCHSSIHVPGSGMGSSVGRMERRQRLFAFAKNGDCCSRTPSQNANASESSSVSPPQRSSGGSQNAFRAGQPQIERFVHPGARGHRVGPPGKPAERVDRLGLGHRARLMLMFLDVSN